MNPNTWELVHRVDVIGQPHFNKFRGEYVLRLTSRVRASPEYDRLTHGRFLVTSSELDFLQAWYRRHCDGDWEHQCGLELGTLDNPGWRLAIDLEGTEAEGRTLERQVVERSADDWLQAWSDGAKFHVAAGPGNLSEAIATFRRFVEGDESKA